MNWYDKVSKDISYIPDAAAYYEAELLAAKHDTRIAGNLEKAAANMPGIVENRFNQLQEIEGILEYLNIWKKMELKYLIILIGKELKML